MNIDEHTIGQLMQRVDDEPRSAARIDVAAAIKAGRRRRHARTAASFGGTAAVVAIVVAAAVALTGVTSHRTPNTPAAPSAPAAAKAIPAYQAPDPAATRSGAPAVPTQCSGRFLPLPSGINGAVITGGDSSGRYLVGYSTDPEPYLPILWTDGQPTLIHADASYGPPVVNSHGEVAGSGISSTSDPRTDEQIAWTYRDGTVTRLLNGDTSYLVAGINNNDDVLAIPMPRFLSGSGNPVVPMAPVVLNGDHVRHLGAVPARNGDLFQGGIDNDGTVVGGDDQSGDTWVWTPDGQPHSLTGRGAYSFASDIRNGWAVGGTATGVEVDLPGEFPAARWDLRTGAVKAFPTVTNAGQVNASGWFVGYSKDGPVAVFGDTIRHLPHVPGADQSEEFAFATTISNDGHVVGGQSDHPGGAVIGPVEWTCH